MNSVTLWRAGCPETGTSGSAGGSWKHTDGNIGKCAMTRPNQISRFKRRQARSAADWSDHEGGGRIGAILFMSEPLT
jgi:hypothetical protein